MLGLRLLVAAALAVYGCAGQNASPDFPEDFMFGVATAAYQIEGAWNVSGKRESIWDDFTHEHPDWIADGSNGDVACDSYHKLDDDLQMLQDLGVDFYRFSFAWSRILPEGHTDQINQDGISYYNKLIDGLIEAGIQPVATMYHWDLPSPLQDLGGWPNNFTADFFVQYARVLFENFGDRVKWWITFNEPKEVTRGYGENDKAPRINTHGVGEYLSAHTILLAHARTYHMYDEEFRATQQGRVSITLNHEFCIPKNDSEENKDAADRCNQFELGWFAHPIYSQEGDYPEVMRTRIDENSAAEGRPFSRLPYFTSAQVEYIKGTFDFFGLNHYTTKLAENGLAGEDPSRVRDGGYVTSFDPSWPTSASDWLVAYPEGIRLIVNWINDTYGDVPILITESGFSDLGELIDTGRQNYYREYLRQLSLAINEDGINVIGYTAWSLMDNFEWLYGYTVRFGLYYVDFEDDDRPRTAKGSAELYKQIVETHQIPEAGSTAAWEW
ncbi:myrosinase 1-like [Schistocerca gregaria]|uniref:myrosinase 1-like n=1 Tax=Schistocerca gregaria TaxID=7010 RepID=UPI00211F0F9D|nr:myrosinase 1-like [Schistocerca gregaria]